MLKTERTIEANDNSTKVSGSLIQTAFVNRQFHRENKGEVQSTLAATHSLSHLKIASLGKPLEASQQTKRQKLGMQNWEIEINPPLCKSPSPKIFREKNGPQAVPVSSEQPTSLEENILHFNTKDLATMKYKHLHRICFLLLLNYHISQGLCHNQHSVLQTLTAITSQNATFFKYFSKSSLSSLIIRW